MFIQNVVTPGVLCDALKFKSEPVGILILIELITTDEGILPSIRIAEFVLIGLNGIALILLHDCI
jgi:hypothetical protein